MRARVSALGHTLKGTVADTWLSIRDAQLPLVASSLAYTTILSIIPLLAVSFSIFHAFGGMEALYEAVEPFLLENLTEGAGEQAMEAIQKYVGNIQTGALGVGGLIGLIITTVSMLSSAEGAINRVWKVRNCRTWFSRLAAYWMFLTLGPLALAIVIGAATSTRFPLSKLLPSGIEMFLITALIFFVIYKWAPSRKVRNRPAAISAFVVSGFWYLARILYGLYNQKVVSYYKIYGALGAIPILILWVYIFWLIVLGGTALSVAVQKRFEEE